MSRLIMHWQRALLIFLGLDRGPDAPACEKAALPKNLIPGSHAVPEGHILALDIPENISESALSSALERAFNDVRRDQWTLVKAGVTGIASVADLLDGRLHTGRLTILAIPGIAHSSARIRELEAFAQKTGANISGIALYDRTWPSDMAQLPEQFAREALAHHRLVAGSELFDPEVFQRRIGSMVRASAVRHKVGGPLQGPF